MTVFPATFYVDYECYLSVSLICGGNELRDSFCIQWALFNHCM